jgi:hypothetical protein
LFGNNWLIKFFILFSAPNQFSTTSNLTCKIDDQSLDNESFDIDIDPKFLNNKIEQLNYNELNETDVSNNELDYEENSEIDANNSLQEDSEDGEYGEKSNKFEDYFIYENSPMKISQFNLLLTLFISRFSLSKKCCKELLKLIVLLLPKPHRIKKSVENLYFNNEINKPIQKYVCSGCWVVKPTIDIQCKNTSCIFKKNIRLKESGLDVLYLDASQQLESILKREKSTILKYKTVR